MSDTTIVTEEVRAAMEHHAELLTAAETGAPGWLSDAVKLIAEKAENFPPADEDEQPPEFLYPH